jgi:CHAD domain-containing protein
VSEPRRFALADDRDLDELVSGLIARAPMVRERTLVVDRTIYDTFDWRLRRRGTVLEHDVELTGPEGGPSTRAEPWLVWRAIDTGEVVGRLRVDEVPRFAWELPAGPTTDRIAAVIDVRALLRLVTIRSEQVVLGVVDADEKTEARIVIDRPRVVASDGAAHVERSVLTTTVDVQPVRGYDRAAERVAGLLAAQVVLRPIPGDLVDEALETVGLAAGSYNSKLSLHLAPSLTADEAFREVLATLFDTMLANEGGTRSNIDSEFLHDFRVAVRRTRSVLGFASGVIDPLLRDELRAGFKWLGDITTPTRDLDVYLLDFGATTGSLPGVRRRDLEPLRRFLAERQRRAHLDLVVALDSPRYAELVARYGAWLHAPAPPPSSTTPDADRPARDVAAERTWKAYRKLVKDGRQIRPDSPPVRLHDLRKDAKKLRYALECFGSLFDADDIAASVRELKGVQDVLGAFQDCEVQKGSLEGFGREMIDEQGASQTPTLLAMGALVEQLDEREQRAREQFVDHFARFDAKPVRRRFRRLFAPPSSHHDEA